MAASFVLTLLPRRLCAIAALLAVVAVPRAAAAPTITRFPVSQTAAVGQNVTFTVDATGTAPLSYQWYRGASAIAGATTTTLTLPNVQVSDAGIYAVAVTDATGTTRTFTAYGSVFAAGTSHTLLTKSDGSLWAMGANGNGQLGDGTTTSRFIAVPVTTGVAAVATGSAHSLILKTDGSLWATGSNGNGQLGDGTTINRSTPVQIATGVATVAAGNGHSLFVKTDGTLWAMGANGNGQLGDGTGTSRLAPVQVASGVQSVTACANHSLFIKTDGTLWAMGANSAGQLGDSNLVNRLAPVQVATGAASVSTATVHTLFLKTDGTVWGMGASNAGQLGDGSLLNRITPVQVMTGVTAIAANGSHSLFLRANGTLWGSGLNNDGQLGDGTTTSRPTAVQVASGVTAMAAGTSCSFVLRADGTLWASGFNSNGQLGDGTTTSRYTPQPVVLSIDTPAILAVNTIAAITDQSASQSVSAGANLTLFVTISGSPSFNYQWFKDGVVIPNAISASYTITAASIAKTGTYTATVSNSVGSVTSQPIVIDLALPITAGQTGVVGRDLGLQANPGGTGTIAWQVSTNQGQTWTTLVDGADYSGTNTSLLRIRHAPAQANGWLYRYQVSDGARVFTSGIATISMFATPLGAPSGIVVDRSGNLIVTDAAASTVLKVAPDLKFTVVAGKMGTAGSTDGTGPNARFNEPTGFILGDDGSITLTDASNSTIRVISATGTVGTFAGLAGTTGAANGDNATVTFNIPTAITADITGTYVIADQMNHLIRTSTGGKTYTLAGRAGIPGFADGSDVSASFFMPSGLAVRRDPFASISWTGGNNAYGTIFVSDQGNNTIRVITNNGQVGTYIGAAGQAGSANGSRTSARLFKPTGLAFDGDGNLYIADTGNHTIRKVTNAGQVSTYAGIPTVSGLMDGPSAQALFNEPEGLAFDSARNLYVTDAGNGVIRKITPTGTVSTLLIVGNVPVITAQPASQGVSTGASVSFSVSATGEGPLSYQWRKDGQPIVGAAASTYTISSAATSHAGSYSVLVTNSWGSTESAAATLTVNSPTNPGNPGGGTSGGGNPGSSGGGGGAPSPFFLGLLAMLALIRRRFAARLA